MKRNLSLFIGFIIFLPFLSAQQIENPGFEEWEEVLTGIEEPVDWSSIKTSDNPSISGLAPITFEISTDAHTGQYSLKLFNVYVTIIGKVVAGTLSNGQYHTDLNPDLGYAFTNPADPQWHQPFTSRPDSIAFWMKYFPQGEDTLQFQALLHVDEGTLPPKPSNEGNRVAYTRADIGGAYENWTRVALKFDYFDDRIPEYLLIILTSGNGTTPIEGSFALFDDLEIIDSGQSLEDNPLEKARLFVSDKTLHIENLSEDILKQAGLEIMDISGRIIWNGHIRSNTLSLDLNRYTEGIYIVKIASSHHFISRKISF